MTKKIFEHILLTVIVSICLVLGLFLNVLYHHFSEQLEFSLKEEAQYIQKAYKYQGSDYFNDLTSENRITLINQDGEVIFDNLSDSAKLENHLLRPEISEAINKGEAFSLRHSQTLDKQIIYYAVKLDDGNILRLSKEQDSVLKILFGMSSQISWIVILAIILAFLMAKRACDKILKPINEMDLKEALSAPYEELQPLVNKIENQKLTIDEQLTVLKQKNQEIHNILENMQDGLIILNQDLKVLAFNKSAEKIFNLQDQDTNISGNLMDTINVAIKKQKSIVKQLHMEQSIYEAIFAPIISDGKMDGLTILIKDITVQTSQEKFRQEFSSNVSHELKTPLTSIVGFAEIMKNGMVDPCDIEDIANDIYQEAKRLIDLVNDIIHLSRLDDNESAFESKSFMVSPVIERVLNSLDLKAKAKKIKLIYEENDISYYGIETLIEELVFNLCDNAISYGVDNGFVKIELNVQNDTLILSVKDNGVGISSIDQERIFERFYRADKSRLKKSGGTGLGLSICKHIALIHGGKIEVFSKLGEGSCFVVYLPLNKNS